MSKTTTKISYKAKIGSQKLDSFFTEEQKEEKEKDQTESTKES